MRRCSILLAIRLNASQNHNVVPLHTLQRGYNLFVFFLKRFYSFIFRDKKRYLIIPFQRNINVWLPLARPLLGTWPAAQLCALTGNRTSNLLVHRMALNLLSHASQGSSKRQKITSVDKNIKKMKPSFIVYGSVKYCSHCGKQSGSSSQNQS